MKTAVVALTAALAGCATAPNTPGAGVGKDYTPIVDLRGIDGARYLADLDGCRNSAGMIDAQREHMMGIIGGALLGAAIGASYTNNSKVIGDSAVSGSWAGGGAAAGRAYGRQERVMGNCMASRGYHVLDGTAQTSFVQIVAPQGQQQVAQQPAAPSLTAATSAAPMPPPIAPAADGIVRLPLPAPNPVSQPTGTDSYAAERVARDAKCNATGLASLIAKGPGYESYSMQCTNGDVMMIRCEMCNCRALR